MSGGLRLSLALPGAAADELLSLASCAERWNIGALWLGDPRARAINGADSYVTTTAGAVSAATEDIRIGIVLRLADERQLPRLAEDVAVADQASGGRVELALVRAGQERDAWTLRAVKLLTAWNSWRPPARDETVAVIPGPVQPVIPRVVVDDGAAASATAAALGAGRMIFGEATPDVLSSLVPQRTILAVEPDVSPGGIAEWIGEGGAGAQVRALRGMTAQLGAQELLLVLRRGCCEADVEALGTVLVPALRASDRDAAVIATDAFIWLTDKRYLRAAS